MTEKYRTLNRIIFSFFFSFFEKLYIYMAVVQAHFFITPIWHEVFKLSDTKYCGNQNKKLE